MSVTHMPQRDQSQYVGRQAAMAILAEASAEEITDGLKALPDEVAHTEARPAETGLVMLRGRVGGDGAPFNVGEATVTRCAVQLSSGELGFSYVLGRDREKAKLAALCDALWQHASYRELIALHVLAPVRQRVDRERQQADGQAAATRVDFFTLVRGED